MSECKYKLKDGVYYMNCDDKEISVDIDAPPQFKANTRRKTVFKHIAKIQQEFIRIARKWQDLSHDLQVAYLRRHPGSKRRVTSPPPAKSDTGRKIYEPARSQSRGILDFMKKSIGVSDPPLWRNYLTNRSDDGKTNKFHYFGVFRDHAGQYVSANAYGRIGYPPQGIKVLSRSDKLDDAMTTANKKLEKKMKKGYQKTKL